MATQRTKKRHQRFRLPSNTGDSIAKDPEALESRQSHHESTLSSAIAYLAAHRVTSRTLA